METPNYCPYCGVRLPERPTSVVTRIDGIVALAWKCSQCDQEWSEVDQEA